MTMPARVALLCVLGFFGAACNQQPQKPQPQTAELQATLSSLNLDDPQKDMFAHVNKGDYQPVAICGFACVAPGLADQANAPNKVVIKYKLRYLRGTTDAPESGLHAELIDTATIEPAPIIA